MMENQTVFEKLGIDYVEREGIYYPKLEFSQDLTQVGKYGRQWITYLQESKKWRYLSLLSNGGLKDRADEVNEMAYQILDNITTQYLNNHKPIHPNSTMEMWELREQAKMVAEEHLSHLMAEGEFDYEIPQ